MNFDELLADAQRQVDAQKKKKAPTTQAEVIAAREALFVPVAQVALFYEQTCVRCGSVERLFEGLFEERKHSKQPDTHDTRLAALPEPNGLPRYRKYLPRDVAYCAACSDLESYEEPV